jgi:tRNA-specific 2-thiouridylase
MTIEYSSATTRDRQSVEKEKKRVVVAMSGGVDSSVAAALLVQEGYDVIGMMMRLWSEPGIQGSVPANRCCTPDQMADARRIADHLGIPFFVVDVQDHFRNSIVQFFIDEHVAGRTPNPCIECNRKIRFTFLLEHALALDANFLATGHYAQVQQAEGEYQLLKGVDSSKDQSYVLHTLNQNKLARVLFPIGKFQKREVRELARQFGLKVAGKKDSQDLCFLADGDYRRFLVEHSEEDIVPGPILTEEGQELGQHAGLPFYTIGQRKKLGISSPIPLHVLHKDKDRNTLVVGPRESLGQRTLFVRDLNWVGGKSPAPFDPIQIKIRYKAFPMAGTVSDLGSGNARVEFEEPVFGITPGQGAVFYNNDICLGGGLIMDRQLPESVGINMQQGLIGGQ